MPRIRRPPIIPGVDPDLLVKDAAKLHARSVAPEFLRGGLSVGALTMLTGCNVSDGISAESVLRRISTFNDRVQAWLFDPNRLAQTYPESAIKRPFRFNAYYPESDSRPRSTATTIRSNSTAWSTTRRPGPWRQLNALPQETQITRLICVEGWSVIGKWTGVPLGRFPAPRRRRPHRQICLVPLRRGLSLARSTWRPRCIRRRR